MQMQRAAEIFLYWDLTSPSSCNHLKIINRNDSLAFDFVVPARLRAPSQLFRGREDPARVFRQRPVMARGVIRGTMQRNRNAWYTG